MPRNFPSFKLVFLLKCRDMKGDVVKDIFEQLLPEDLKENTKGGLVNTLENLDDQNQICIILDGLDELPEQSGDCLDKVLGRKKLSSCYVLATTRQEKGIDTREQFKFNRCLAIEGFSEDNSFEFIRKYFRNVGPEDACKGEKLIKVVKRNPLLRKLQNNPLKFTPPLRCLPKLRRKSAVLLYWSLPNHCEVPFEKILCQRRIKGC